MGRKVPENADTAAVERLLPPKRQLALEHALSGLNHGEIAKAVGVHPDTVTDWFRDPVFAQELAERQAARRASVGRWLESQIDPSLRTLAAIRDDKDAKDADRIKASESLLDRALGKPIAQAAEPEMSDDELERWVAEQMSAEEPAEERETEDA